MGKTNGTAHRVVRRAVSFWDESPRRQPVGGLFLRTAKETAAEPD